MCMICGKKYRTKQEAHTCEWADKHGATRHANGKNNRRKEGKRMKTISVINLKGGVAKTTTSINLSTLLGDRWGRRVLLIDNDKQGNTSQFFGKYIKDATCGSARILQGEEPVIFTTNHGIDLINANMSLETAENKLLKSNERQDVKLKQFLEGKANQYDFCIIDNPPAVGMCAINALCASDEVIVPVKLDNWAIDGTEMITATIEQLKALNKNLKKITVLITDFIKTPESVAAEEWIRKNCKVPVFKTKIRFSKKVDSATYYKEPLDRYSLMCAAAVDYRKLAKEYLGKE